MPALAGAIAANGMAAGRIGTILAPPIQHMQVIYMA